MTTDAEGGDVPLQTQRLCFALLRHCCQRHTPAATLLTMVVSSTGSLPTKLMKPGRKANRLHPRSSVPFP